MKSAAERRAETERDAKVKRWRLEREARDATQPKAEWPDSHHRVLGLRDEMPFGKYRGRTVEDVIDEDIGYVTWLLENTGVELNREAEEEYNSRLDPRRPRGAWVDK